MLEKNEMKHWPRTFAFLAMAIAGCTPDKRQEKPQAIAQSGAGSASSTRPAQAQNEDVAKIPARISGFSANQRCFRSS